MKNSMSFVVLQRQQQYHRGFEIGMVGGTFRMAGRILRDEDGGEVVRP